MARRRWRHEIGDRELLQVLMARYVVDVENGDVLSLRTGKPLSRMNPAVYGGKTCRDCVRIAVGGRRRNVTIARAVWMVSRGSVVPERCEIHHMNEDSSDNRDVNLVCVHEADHGLVHKLLSGNCPF